MTVASLHYHTTVLVVLILIIFALRLLHSFLSGERERGVYGVLLRVFVNPVSRKLEFQKKVWGPVSMPSCRRARYTF
jgi:hypothetical protein